MRCLLRDHEYRVIVIRYGKDLEQQLTAYPDLFGSASQEQTYSMAAISVGSIVKCCNREWVVLPSPDEELYLLRPLAGSEHETIRIHYRLATLGLDRIEPAHFPLPNFDQAGDTISVELLFNAARLTLCDGAGPFRSLGHINVRPRPYQFVPLLMALRLDPVRMLIADDVGIGKTIEALLVAREMLDRGETTRTCVLCPPYLCSQWQQELWDKFRLRAVIIRSGTISQLERDLPSGEHSIFGYYPHIFREHRLREVRCAPREFPPACP